MGGGETHVTASGTDHGDIPSLFSVSPSFDVGGDKVLGRRVDRSDASRVRTKHAPVQPLQASDILRGTRDED